MIKQKTYIGHGGIKLVADLMGNPNHPAVILLHGGGQTRHSWQGAMEALATSGYYVINLDGRGHGESEWANDGNYSVERRSLDLQTIMDQINSPCALVGASMGGATALYTALTTKKYDITSVILVDIVVTPSKQGVQRITDFMHKHLDGFDSIEQVIDAVATYNPHRKRADPEGLSKNLRKTEDGRLRWHWDPNLLKMMSPKTEVATMRDTLESPNLKYDIPTLLVRGMQSDVITDNGVKHMQTHIPHIEVYNVTGAGHMVAGDKNDAFNQGVIDYLERHHQASI